MILLLQYSESVVGWLVSSLPAGSEDSYVSVVTHLIDPVYILRLGTLILALGCLVSIVAFAMCHKKNWEIHAWRVENLPPPGKREDNEVDEMIRFLYLERPLEWSALLELFRG